MYLVGSARIGKMLNRLSTMELEIKRLKTELTNQLDISLEVGTSIYEESSTGYRIFTPINLLGLNPSIFSVNSCVTTIDSVIVTTSNSFLNVRVGDTVTGTGIPASTTVASVDENTLELSQPATSDGLVSLSFNPPAIDSATLFALDFLIKQNRDYLYLTGHLNLYDGSLGGLATPSDIPNQVYLLYHNKTFFRKPINIDLFLKNLRSFPVQTMFMQFSTNHSGSFSVNNVVNSGATLLWDFGDGSPQVENNMPTHVYSDNSQKVITVYSPDGWKGVTTFDLRNVSVIGDLPYNLGDMASLNFLYLYNGDYTGSIPPSVAALDQLIRIRLQNNNLEGKIPTALAYLPAIREIKILGNNFSEADLSDFVNDLWNNRIDLGSRLCLINLEGNNGLSSKALDQVNGTGDYTGDGLVQAGCTVTY